MPGLLQSKAFKLKCDVTIRKADKRIEGIGKVVFIRKRKSIKLLIFYFSYFKVLREDIRKFKCKLND